MKFVLKNLLIFVIVTVIIFFVFTTQTFYSFCKENQLKIFCPNEYSGLSWIEKPGNFKLRTLGVGIIEIADLVENEYEDEYDATGYSLWEHMQITVFEITQYYMLSIILGISITFGYNIILSKKFNKILKIVIGYILPIITMPTLYYFIRSNGKFVEQNKLVYFFIIYTVIFIAMNIANYMIKKENSKKNI